MSFHLHDVVRVNKPGSPAHDLVGRVWANRTPADNQDASKRWTVDFTPNATFRITFAEDELEMVLPLSDSHKDLLEAAQGVLTDERHWTQVDVADRADCAASLANGVLSFFSVQEDSCPAGCEDCLDHAEALG